MLRLTDVSFVPLRGSFPGLSGVSFDVRSGEQMRIFGASRSGKTTLLRLVVEAGLRRPKPGFAGQIDFGFRSSMPGRLAALFDDANWAFCNLLVEEELAFALENGGIAGPEMRARVAEMLAALGLDGFERRRISTLSGGEKRKLALGAMMISDPDVVISDDLDASLDLVAIPIIRGLLAAHVEASGAVWLDLTRKLDDDDLPTGRYAVLAGGTVSVHAGDAPGTQASLAVIGQAVGVPAGEAVRRALFATDPCGGGSLETPAEAAEALARAGVKVRSSARAPNAGSASVVQAHGLRIAFSPAIPVLDGCDLTLRSGSIHVLAGRNGAGKTTLARVLLGLLRPQSGSFTLAGVKATSQELRRAGALVFQNPEYQFVADNVLAEAALALAPGLGPGRAREAAVGLLDRLELGDRIGDHPMTLSMGERRRLAVATALAGRPRFLVIDEPTLGQDLWQTQILARQLRAAADGGMAILVITHDVDFIVDVADSIGCLHEGVMTELGVPGRAFSPSPGSLFGGRSRLLSIWSQLAERGIAEGFPPRRPEDLHPEAR